MRGPRRHGRGDRSPCSWWRCSRSISCWAVARGSFWIRKDGRWVATPLFVALVVVELTDLAFALDSVPAVLAVTREPFIVYTSNVFAMLGLRSSYFLLAGIVERFHAVRYALAGILAFVGAKILLSDVVHVPNWISLAVVVGALSVAATVSVRFSNRHEAREAPLMS